MDPLVGTLVLILLALVGSRFSFSTERVRSGPRLLFRTGTHFLIVGFLLGPEGFGLLTGPATERLFPFLALGLGWVGFHFGLQLSIRSLRQFPLVYHLLGAGQALLTLVLFFGAGWFLLGALGVEGDLPMLLLAASAAIASVTTPAGIAMVSSNFLVRGNVRDLLFYTSSVDAGVGILALQVVYSIYRPGAAPQGAALDPLSVAGMVGVAAGLGVACGIVFVWLLRSRPAPEELVLYILGSCAFAAGAALQWGLSPLFVSLVMGVVVANFDLHPQRLFSVLERWEKPVYLIFLLLAGALLTLPTLWVVGLAFGYALLRAFAKAMAGGGLSAVLPFPFPRPPRRLGLGLLPQGGISIAMAVSGVLLYPELELAGRNAKAILFTVIVIGVMISELVGPFFTARVLRLAGEISPGAEEALARGDQREAEREALRHTSTPDRVGEAPDGDG